MPTTGYAAAIDSNDIIMAYAPEAVWGTKPAVAFQDIRLDSEGFTSSKTRVRPNEINPAGQESAAITTKMESPGSLNFSVSAGTHNDLLAASIGGTFGTAINFANKTTVAATASGFTDSANGFVTAGIQVGQMIKVSGFTTTGAADNTVYRVDTVVAGVITTTPTPAATKTAGDSVTIKGSMCRNGSVFQSFFFQKTLSSVLYLQYGGAWPNGGSLDVAVADYLKGTLSFLNKSEAKAVADGSTGAHTAAPTGNVIDSINGIANVMRNGAAVNAVVQKVGVKWSRNGSAQQFGIGSAAAQGVRKGKVLVGGSLATYFKDFSMYDEFIAESASPFWFTALDNAGKGYAITITNATIMNPKIVAGGAGQDIMATFDLEGNPDTSGKYAGCTIQLDYFN